MSIALQSLPSPRSSSLFTDSTSSEQIQLLPNVSIESQSFDSFLVNHDSSRFPLASNIVVPTLPPPTRQGAMLLELYGDQEARMQCVAIFGYGWEEAMEKWDQIGIRMCQEGIGGSYEFMSRGVAMVWTVITSIEVGIGLPFWLLMVGWDGLGMKVTVLMLLTAILSQVPKRFIWRARPFMTEPPRAVAIAQNFTSSFPSRAVVCSAVYGYIFSLVLIELNALEWPSFFIFTFFITLFILFASYSRIFYGVHFPSDCAAGAIFGLLICLAGYTIHQWIIEQCLDCTAGACYAVLRVISMKEDSAPVYLPNFIVAVSVCLGITFLSIIPPLMFWKKCGLVYGSLLPCVLFRFTFLCKPLNPYESALVQPHFSSEMQIFATLIAIGCAIFCGVFTLLSNYLI